MRRPGGLGAVMIALVVYGIVIGPPASIVYQDIVSSNDRRLVYGSLEFVIGRPAPVPGA